MSQLTSPEDQFNPAVYGFKKIFITDTAPEVWREKRVADGKKIGVWNGGFKIHFNPLNLQPKDFAALGIEETENLFSPHSLKLNNPWEAMELFMEGPLDEFQIANYFIEFPVAARGLLSYIRLAAKAQEGSLPLPTSCPETLEASESNPFLWNLTGKCLAICGKVSEAGKIFEKIAERYPEFSESYGNLGALLWKFGKRREAFVMFTESLGRNPFSSSAQLNFFEAGRELQEFSAMTTVLQKIIHQYPYCLDLYSLLAVCFYQIREVERAKSVLNDLLRESPEDSEGKLLLHRITQSAEWRALL